MTEWQWQVILALIRYVIGNMHYELSLEYTDEQKLKDATLLGEALDRDRIEKFNE